MAITWKKLVFSDEIIPLTRTISTTAPLTGGGALSSNLTIAISAATGAAPGSMSAVDKTKLDAITGTHTGNNTGDQSLAGLGGVATTRTISTTAPLTGGGDLSANRTLAISAATTSAAGSLSAADKTKLDGLGTASIYNAGNSASQIPINNTTVNTDLNADMVDGKHVGAGTNQIASNTGLHHPNLNAGSINGFAPGNGSGNVPISNGVINTNLNANLLQGYYASDLVPKVSAGRPGVARLYRRDSDDGYNVQTWWTGTRWMLQGYLPDSSGGTLHAGCHVAYADLAGGSYVPITSTGIWNNAAIAVGTYDYNVTSYGCPSGVRAVVVRSLARWAAASATSYQYIRRTGTDTIGGLAVWAQTAGIQSEGSAVIQVDSNLIRAIVSGVATTNSWLAITGYFL